MNDNEACPLCHGQNFFPVEAYWTTAEGEVELNLFHCYHCGLYINREHITKAEK